MRRVLGDLNTTVGNKVIKAILVWSTKKNESSKQLLDIWAEQELVVGTFFSGQK